MNQRIERVRAAIESLNYTPNQAARNLRRNETRVILALAPNFSNPYYSNILTGIGDLAHENGYSVFICNTDGQAENEKKMLEMLDDLDDVQDVYHNGELPEDEEEDD